MHATLSFLYNHVYCVLTLTALLAGTEGECSGAVDDQNRRLFHDLPDRNRGLGRTRQVSLMGRTLLWLQFKICCRKEVIF